jgi:glycosyltransferase involved in cell wall biosynthesis
MKVIVSVIVPCYNYAHFLGEALDSVLAQTYPHWECIIINDGSPDNTEEVALNYCKKDERIKYFYKENGGHSSARNFGIKHSSGKFILPLDADDTLQKNYLEEAVTKIQTSSDIKLVTAQVQHFGDIAHKYTMPPYDLKSYLMLNYISVSTLFRREDFEKVGGFDERMVAFEDWDLFVKILKTGGHAVELSIQGLNYRRKKESLFGEALKDNKRIFNDLLILYNNNVDVYGKYFDSPVSLIQENEKMKRVIAGYQQTKTYKLGLFFNEIKNFLKSNKS